MTVSEEEPPTTTERLAALFAGDEDARDGSRFATPVLGLVAAALVAASTVSAVETGHPAVGASFLAAVVLFLGSVSVFEASNRLGTDD